MKLRQAEALRVLDDHHRRVRNIHADFDDCGRDEDVDVAATESLHRRLTLFGRHAAVDERDPPLRESTFAERSVAIHRRLDVHLVGLFDERADEIDLMPSV